MTRLTLLLLGVLSIGCNESSRNTNDTGTNTGSKDQSRVTADRDNTAVNTRDREDTAKTPINQNENQADIDITANIRKRVVDTKLSVNAQNVKIITQDGHVTLRGPVKSDEEKKQIEDIARDVAGADKVDNQLEVEQNP
jgi:hyperosmotically inducible protein